MRKQKVLVTRAKEQSSEFLRNLEHAGYAAFSLPMIRTEQVSDLTEIETALDQLEQYDWLIFTSANAVRYFFEAVEKYKVKLYFYSELKIATVGEKTKQYLEQLGYRTNFVPIKFTAEVLAENIGEIEGKKVLIPRASGAGNAYVKAMEKRGAQVQVIDLYHTFPINYNEREFDLNMKKEYDFITFASPSAVKAFYTNQSRSKFVLSDKERIVCIGPSTARQAEELGLHVESIANPHTAEGMIDAIKKLAND